MKYNYQLIVEYDGSKFVGWQYQKNGISIQEKIEKSIKKGFAVCIWPDTVKFKDINDMVVGEMDILEIIDIINMNTYRGLPARIKFNQWKRS